MNSLTSIRSAYERFGRWAGAAVHAPSRTQQQVLLFAIGIVLLSAGLLSDAAAQEPHEISYNAERIDQAITALLTYLEGSFGALVMVAAGLAAILASAMGQYKAALGCLIVAVGSFILRSFMHTFFNLEDIE